ncbi:MAG: hypothetical protein Q9165_000062 [Trypethelium subeluteriae]
MRTRAASRTASIAPSDSRNGSSAGSNKSTATGRKRRASSLETTTLIGGEERPAKRSRSNAPADNVITSPPRSRAAKRKAAGLYEEKDTDHDDDEITESERPPSSGTSRDAKSESQPDEVPNAEHVNGDAHGEDDDRKDSLLEQENANANAGNVSASRQPSPTPADQTTFNNATPGPGSPASAAAAPKLRGRGRWGRPRVPKEPKEPKPSVEPSDRVVKKRLPGRRRAPNPNDSIEADMRRQLQIRMGYRAVVKHLKPILQEIANRTEEKIDSDPEYHKQSDRYEIVNAQLDDKLQQRLDHIDTEEGYTVGNAANNYERGCELLRTQYQENIERVKDNLIGHLMNAYLTILRDEGKQNDEDATDDEVWQSLHQRHDSADKSQEGGVVPYAKRRHLNGDLEPMSDTRFDSRSRYFVETDRLWDECQERDRIAGDISKIDESAKPQLPGKFAVHDSADRNQAIAILNVSNLARASQAVEEGITEPPKHIENSAAMALQALATAAETMPLARKPPKKPEPPPEPPTPTLPQEIITPSKPPNTTPQSSSSTTQEKPGSVYVKWRLESHKKSKSGQMNGVRSSKKEAPTRSPAKISELLNQDQAEERVAPSAAKRPKVAEDEFRPMGQIPPFSQRPVSPIRMLGERREGIPGEFDHVRHHSITQHPQPRPNEFAAVPMGSDRMHMLQEPLREPRPLERPPLQPPAQFPNEKRDYYQTPYRERSLERAPMPPPALQHVSNAHRRTRTGSGSASALASPSTPSRADQSPVAGPNWPPRRGSVERPTYAEDRRASMDTSHQRVPPAAMPPILHPTQPEPNRPQEHGYRPRAQSHPHPYPPNQAPPPNPPPPPYHPQYAHHHPPPPPPPQWSQAGSPSSFPPPPPSRYSGHGPLGPPPPPPNLPPATTQPYPQTYSHTLPPPPPPPQMGAYPGFGSHQPPPPPPPPFQPGPPPPSYTQPPPPAAYQTHPLPPPPPGPPGPPGPPHGHAAPPGPHPTTAPQYAPQQFGGQPILPANMDPRQSHPPPATHHMQPSPAFAQYHHWGQGQGQPPPPPTTTAGVQKKRRRTRSSGGRGASQAGAGERRGE